MASASSLTYVQKTYIAYYGRAADPLGQEYWAGKLDVPGATLAGIIDAFGNSAEATTLFSGMSNAAKVNAIYKQCFGRDADVGGLTFYANALTAGTYTHASIMLNILNGATGTDATAVANKLTAANLYTAALNTTAEIIAYSGNTAAASARTFLATVTDVATTVPTAAAVDTSVASMVTGATAATGQTYTLTKDIDNFPGTVGNDTFIGDAATASPADQLAGGTGTDILKLYGTTTKPVISGIEQVYLNAPAGDFNVSANTDVTSLEVDSEAMVAARTYTVTTGQAVKLTNITGAVNNLNIAGNTPSSLDVTVNKAGSAAAQQVLDLKGTALTTLNLTSATATSNLSLVNAGGKLATVNFSGDQAVKLDSALATLTTINAATATGALNVNSVAGSNLTFTGGTGGDRINMVATITVADKLDGGAGTDTLALSDADTMTTLTTVNIKNFEVLEATTADATAYNVDAIIANNPLTGIRISESGGGGITVSNINAGAVNNIQFTGDIPTTVALSAKDFVAGGTSDTATILLDNSVSKNADGVDVATSLTFTQVDILNIKSVSDGSPAAGEQNSIAALTATDLDKIVITGDQELALETAAGTVPSEIDASGLTRALSLDTDPSAIISLLVKGTAKADTYDLDNAATITTTIYTGGGSDGIILTGGGTGAHTLKFTATEFNSGDFKAGDVIGIALTGAAGGDKVTLDFGSALEALMKSGGVVLGTSAANVNIYDGITATTLGANTNVAASQVGGTLTIDFDMNGDGLYNVANDVRIFIIGTGTNDTLLYNAANDNFVFTVV